MAEGTNPIDQEHDHNHKTNHEATKHTKQNEENEESRKRSMPNFALLRGFFFVTFVFSVIASFRR